ncbi:MAG TPA: pyridoxamine 5'-phosphate oxidase family protein [Ktedonobacteraceae bacterium]|nr:pyridoxamine 5'-phosphate oxidase family protein [Ktedonobacteraceae bacterium]
MEVTHFSEIEEEFLQRVHTMVWCSVATIDRKQRPRSRILHPIWEGVTGWIATHPHSHKAQHLEHCPYISLAYITISNSPSTLTVALNGSRTWIRSGAFGSSSRMLLHHSVSTPRVITSARIIPILGC